MGFLKTTLLGGAVVVVPAYLAVLLVMKALLSLRPLVMPVVGMLPPGLLHPTLAAAILMVGGCFVAGVLLRTGVGRALGRMMERSVLLKIPGYGMLRSILRRLGGEQEENLAVALVEQEEGCLVPAFVVERLPNDHYTVFIPSVPTPAVGAVQIVPGSRVRIVDVPMAQAIKSLTQWGTGAGALLSATKPPAAKT
jgi:uncharacterized membrane protein